LPIIEGPAGCCPGQSPRADAWNLQGDHGSSWCWSLVLAREAPYERAQHKGQVLVVGDA
jgi:hypothetical protein